MIFFTADLCDDYPDKIYVLDNEFTNYGTGKIVVVDVQNEYCAVVGENIFQ